MICTLTARRLKPGSFDEFRQEWLRSEDREEAASRWNPVYVCRDVNDENVILSFGMFQGSLPELREAQEQFRYNDQVQRVSDYVEEVLLDGAYEVVEEIT